MNITKVTVKKIEGQQMLRGVASVVLDDEIKDIKILERESGLSIMMPNKKVADGKYVGYAYPVTEKARSELQEAILAKYYEMD